ncbi:MAG: CD225/dispanin family protein [Chitinophagaceae bacterium]
MEQQPYQQVPAHGAPPKNWLVESILVTIFCCLPFGIAGIVFASQVNSKWVVGDYNGALQASKDAAKWTKIGFFVGIAFIVLYLIAVFALGFGGLWMSSRSLQNNS